MVSLYRLHIRIADRVAAHEVLTSALRKEKRGKDQMAITGSDATTDTMSVATATLKEIAEIGQSRESFFSWQLLLRTLFAMADGQI